MERQSKRAASAGTVLTAAVIVALLGLIGYCGFNIMEKLLEYRESSSIYTGYANEYASIAATSEPAGIQAELPVKTPIAVADSKPAAHEHFPVDVNFDALLRDNPDVIGWIYNEGTQINYPVVQSGDNDFYLHRLVNKEYNYGGTIFMDCVCRGDFSGRNSILYGHHMNDGSMFASIVEYKAQKYYDEHPVMYLATPIQNYRVRVMSCFVTTGLSDVYTYAFAGDGSFMKWCEDMIERSVIKTGCTPTAASRMVTLSTCSYEHDGARTVVIGVLEPSL